MPTLKTQRITLQVAWDDRHYPPPSQWDWADLTDMDPDDIKIVGVGVPQDTDREVD
jgi:hypothetical protein